MSWNLESLYAGGAQSAAYCAELDGLERSIGELDEALRAASTVAPAADVSAAVQPQQAEALLRLPEWTERLQAILLRLRQAESFVSCLLAQNMKDDAAAACHDRVQTLAAAYQAMLTRYDAALAQLSDQSWRALLARPELAAVAFGLEERRLQARERLAPELEALAGELAVDGYHAWGELYNTIVAQARFRSPDASDDQEEWLSAGQMHNRLSGGDRALRERAYDEWERVWEAQAPLCADALNRIAGFRLKLYARRGWESVLKEPLQLNRMSEATLTAMWSAVEAGKAELTRYLGRKAELLGVERLDWHDVEAPLGAAAKTMPYDEAGAFIVERFRAFSPAMADFAARALQEGWVEAEDRPGKRPGGFCTAFPVSRQTRIFMTYSGTPSNVATLAHELGHAYHQHLMDDLPPLAQEYAMNVAETASTFAEMLVADSALQLASDPQERLGLLEDKLGRAVAFFMNIHARFQFETAFYERRRSGLVSAQEIGALMTEAQTEAFAGTLGRPHPHFWASKLHFYLTDVPFYNFPYTFGYLFSSGIYARALAEGPAFAARYDALLRDTGRMSVEELAQRHLGVRLDEPQFWREAVRLATSDVEAFMELTAR
ncbi:M3 family oligoendopeptidase [Paenibacillus sabuli]|nr:M3 family oligoendopeptidase [Paenibacillus sabuli]